MTDFEKTEIERSEVEGKTPVTPDSASGNYTAAERAAFLSSFTPEEDRKIRNKVDRRILWVIAMMYTLKNVGFLIAVIFRTPD